MPLRTSDHKRTKNHAVGWAAPRSFVVSPGTNLMQKWGPRPTRVGRVGNWELRKKARSVGRTLFEKHGYDEEKRDKALAGR